MLGRGVKRKWSSLEELGANLVLDTPVMGDNEGPSKPDTNHLQQRQLVLGLCLEKLQRYQAGMELSLRRSVLLVNTLKQIQEEMRSDSCLFVDDMSVTCPGCVEEETILPLDSEFSSQQVDGSSDQHKPPPAAAISAFGDAVGYLSDLALDDIFEDIDTSMYESSDLPSAWAAGPSWPLSSCLTDLNELDHIMEILVNLRLKNPPTLRKPDLQPCLRHSDCQTDY
uniref:Si:dkey-177p2.6 n=1 Tax=Gouania willdenowi TaxID=441366 RepID=A0A8C5NEI1_GOUWI